MKKFSDWTIQRAGLYSTFFALLINWAMFDRVDSVKQLMGRCVLGLIYWWLIYFPLNMQRKFLARQVAQRLSR